MKLIRLFTFLGVLGTLATSVFAFDPEKDVKVSFNKGAVLLSVPPGVHLKKSFTEVSLASKPGTLKVGTLPPANAKDELQEEVYRGTVRIPMTGEGLSGVVTLEVQYQACTEGEGGACFPPTTKELTVKAVSIPATKAASAK